MTIPPWSRVAAAMFVVGWGANQFTSLLLVYRATEHFSQTLVTAMFAAYVLGLVPALLIAAIALSAGFGGRAILVEFMAQWLPDPKVLPYVVHVALTVVAAVLVWSAPVPASPGRSPAEHEHSVAPVRHYALSGLLVAHRADGTVGLRLPGHQHGNPADAHQGPDLRRCSGFHRRALRYHSRHRRPGAAAGTAPGGAPSGLGDGGWHAGNAARSVAQSPDRRASVGVTGDNHVRRAPGRATD